MGNAAGASWNLSQIHTAQRLIPLDKFKMADQEDNDSDFFRTFADVPLNPPEKRDMCARCK